jgi:hypothetical protein
VLIDFHDGVGESIPVLITAGTSPQAQQRVEDSVRYATGTARTAHR